MKTIKLFVIIAFLTAFQVFSQQHFPEKKEQIRALKVGFITNELSLTTEEAAKFWPLYNAFDDKQFELRHHKLRAFRNRMETDFEKISEKEAAALLDKMETNEEELFQLRKKFIANLKGVLPSIKIIKLKKAEDDFNKKLLKQYRNRGPRN